MSGPGVLEVADRQLDLVRHRAAPDDPRRAWDAADEYVLAHLGELGLIGGAAAGPVQRMLVVNGGPGAVPTALAVAAPTGASVVAMGDSYTDRLATMQNLARNGMAPDAVVFVGSLDPVATSADLPFDVVVVKIPKSSALLEDQLCRIAPYLGAGTVVIGAGMVKHVHTSTIELFSRIVGPTTTSLARKKARLLFASPDPSVAGAASPWPTTIPFGDAGGSLVNHASVFSRDRLDIGTRFLLDHLPSPEGPCHAVDLGCGNGIVGTVLAGRHPETDVVFVDESYMAVASARATFAANGGDPARARFVVGDGLATLVEGDPIDRGTVDLVVVNPPFHDDHALSDAVAWQMFTESAAALRPGGELWVVGNRHLAYHAKLKRIFGNCAVEASNSKFVVYRAVRS